MVRYSYLNNAATSYPKPRTVTEAITATLQAPPVDPGRTGGGNDIAKTCRKQLSALLNVADPLQVALLPSATYALNLAIHGLVNAPGAHVVTTELEHNSVLRPIANRIEELGGEVTFVPPNEEGQVEASAVVAAFRAETALVVVSHASNVTGCIQPIDEIAARCANARVPLVVDAAQSIGCVPIDYESLPGRVFLAFAGHKGLLGPTGVGGLVVPDNELPQQIVGGTGIRSESPTHPSELPLRHEAGTPNTVGIAGFSAGLEHIARRGVEVEGDHRHNLVMSIRRHFEQIEDVQLSPLSGGDGRAGIVSFTLASWSPEDLGFILRQMYNIETRSGLHCAPMAHRTLGTESKGTIRVSLGSFNGEDDVVQLVRAIREIRKPCQG